MTVYLPVRPAPDPLKAYCRHVDPVFAHHQHSGRERLRRYVDGLSWPRSQFTVDTVLCAAEDACLARDTPRRLV